DQDFHRLFDALLLKKKFEMGLPLTQPTSFDDVPEDKQQEFEENYVVAARRIGESFLDAGKIPQAWVYLRTISEPQKVTQAIEDLEQAMISAARKHFNSLDTEAFGCEIDRLSAPAFERRGHWRGAVSGQAG
ncbi:MAG: hypothetical protein IH789_12590, partial [Acidobacteria bacterium]|nr:hypothetical protein [Acidobacteriota bacterium]